MVKRWIEELPAGQPVLVFHAEIQTQDTWLHIGTAIQILKILETGSPVKEKYMMLDSRPELLGIIRQANLESLTE